MVAHGAAAPAEVSGGDRSRSPGEKTIYTLFLGLARAGARRETAWDHAAPGAGPHSPGMWNLSTMSYTSSFSSLTAPTNFGSPSRRR